MRFSLDGAARLERRIVRLDRRIDTFGVRVSQHQQARLMAGGAFFAALVIAAIRPDWGLGLPAFVVFAVVFTWLVLRTRNLSQHHQRLQQLKSFFQRQINRSQGRPSGREEKGTANRFPASPLVRDLGLFGPHSLWTLLDETLTDDGERELASWMTSPPLDSDQIIARQGEIQALRSEAWFYTRLTLIADSAELRVSTGQIREFLKAPFTEPNFARAYALVLALWIGALAVSGWSIASGSRSFVAAFAVFALIHFSILFRGGSVFKKGIGLSHHLSLLTPIFAGIERRTQLKPSLRTLCPTIHDSGPSRQTKKLNRVLGFLGVETNPLLHLLLNAFLPWSSTGAYFLELRRRRIADTFPACMEELTTFEALGSLVIFDRYQTRVYPVLSSDKIDASAAFHPLIDRTKVIANDFAFPNGRSLGLLTGSNMSGKSTFLRTIGINQILANMGAPVFAERFATRPLRVDTCIEVSDSLRDGFSYFYAEVRRLKSLLDDAHAPGTTLFLIDEIFRGTNNRERQIGSRAVIRTLAKAKGAQGFISTHDLELTQLESTEPTVMNLHFREEVRGSEMIFPYKLHHGPCPTTNALKIMQAEGIRIEDADLVSN